MNKLAALLKLIRWPNLVFIALAQILVSIHIVYPRAHFLSNQLEMDKHPSILTPISLGISFNWQAIILLILSTVLIAAAGYMINDYFDVRIDSVNKPDKLILSKVISRKAMIYWHVILNSIALLLVLKLAWDNQFRLLGIQVFCIAALVVYSMSFKRKLFIGNILVGLLIGFSILLVGIYEPFFKVLSLDNSYSKLIWLYAIFAFLITLVREIIKDTEDMKGDLKEACRTIPIVYGIETTKKILYGIYFLLIGLVVAFVSRLYEAELFLCIYFIVCIVLPSFFILYKIKSAKSTKDFAQLSSWVKWLTLAGILSMFLIQF